MIDRYLRLPGQIVLILCLSYFVFSTYSILCVYHHSSVTSTGHQVGHHHGDQKEKQDHHCPLSSALCNWVHNSGNTTAIPSLYMPAVLLTLTLSIAIITKNPFIKILSRNLKSRSPPLFLI